MDGKKLLVHILLFFCYVHSYAQTVEIVGEIEDDFLKVPLSGVKVSILNPDSTVVVDSAKVVDFIDRNGKLLQVMFSAAVKAEKRDYLVHATRSGYTDVWKPVSVLFPENSSVRLEEPIKMRKERNLALDEVVVKATKVKMYYKGDTLVYDADAFKLPDGSMLDALIRQLPGVTMNEGGEIFVNGRRVDELLLGSRTFFRGNKKVLMENLPYYTVKNLKVYEKQTDKSEALGYDVEPRKYVMDVNLKNEYNQGYIANVEAAGGTEDRWLGRGFLLGFTDRWRYALLGNVNNVNESRHIGEHGHWSPGAMPQSLLTTRSVATDLDYQSKDKKVTNNFNADFTSTDTESEMRQRYEQFLEGGKPMSLTENRNESDNWHLKLVNRLVFKKPSYFDFTSYFDYDKWDARGRSGFEQWDKDLTASMHANALSEGRGWAFCQESGGTFNINKEKQWYGGYSLFFRYSDNQSWLSNHYDTWQTVSQAEDVRYNASDVSKRWTNFSLNTYFTFSELWGKVNFLTGGNVQFSGDRSHDYLYHPDTLLLASQLDMLTAITDPSNSYDSHQRNWHYKVYLALSQQASYSIGDSPLKIMYDRWRIGVDVPVSHQSLDYKRGVIDTLAHDTKVFFTPNAAFRHMSKDGKQDLRIGVGYNCSPADLLNQIGYHDDSQPLVVKEGNPGLKGTATTSGNADYTQKYGKHVSQWHVGAAFNYRHRDVAQSASYNPVTGVYTYKPMNVSGAYSATARFDISANIGEKRYWTWQMNADANYDHSVDHAMLAGETESHVNTVNTTVLHDGAYIQYNKDVFNIRASGDIRWRHSEGRMHDFEMLDALDFNYGLSARYTIPRIKTTLSADATMYSRRGYGSEELNTDDFVLNASLSQPFWKGKLIARIEAFDLLHQVSSTQYSVNAQGRTETWFRSLPHYVMLHLVFHWNKNPKKGGCSGSCPIF